MKVPVVGTVGRIEVAGTPGRRPKRSFNFARVTGPAAPYPVLSAVPLETMPYFTWNVRKAANVFSPNYPVTLPLVRSPSARRIC